MTNTLENFISEYQKYGDLGRVEVYDHIAHKDRTYPLVSIHYGNHSAPTLLVSGGVHGLERIGAQLTLSLLDSFHHRLQWDTALQQMLQSIHVVFVPLVNPVGYFEITRGNENGVDLMRNAPIEAEDKVPFLLGGHYWSNKIHWFRGREVQVETKFLFHIVENILKQSDCLVSLDVHSGFGFRDQLWFPFAGNYKKFTQVTQMFLLFELFEKSHPYHMYKIEPQSKNYLTHGDIWDYCFKHFKKENQVYLPLTLEMGSWIWVKKNPWQIFSKTGLFNPIKAHRMNRTLRRHRPFFDFLLHALNASSTWTEAGLNTSAMTLQKAQAKYYDSTK